MVDFCLASNSPRRKELLLSKGFCFSCVSPSIDESKLVNEFPHDYVKRMASTKALSVYNSIDVKLPCLGADTVVIIDNKIIGKPKNYQDCFTTLKLLSGREHIVITAVSLVSIEFKKLIYVESKVTFNYLDDKEILEYWNTGEPCDKAGSYAIQGRGRKFVKSFQGSYTNIVGLPIEETESLLRSSLSHIP